MTYILGDPPTDERGVLTGDLPPELYVVSLLSTPKGYPADVVEQLLDVRPTVDEALRFARECEQRGQQVRVWRVQPEQEFRRVPEQLIPVESTEDTA